MSMNAELCGENSQVCAPTAAHTNKLRQGFVNLAESLLESIADVFPECDNTTAVLRIFRALIKDNAELEDKFIWRCHKLFKEYSDGIQRHDSETLFVILEQMDHLRDIDLREKWEDPDFTDDSKANLWQYVCALKTYADLYTAVPKNVMNKIETVAGDLGDQLVKGQLDLKNMDIGALGQSLLADMSPEELSHFEGKLPEIYNSLAQVAGSWSGGQGANLNLADLMKQIAEQDGDGNGSLNGKVDMTNIIQKLVTQMPPQGLGKAGANIDLAQMMQTMGPLVSAMGASQGSLPNAGTQDASAAKKSAGPRERGKKKN